MGQFPSSMLGGCECGGGDLAILDSAGRLTLLWILLASPDLQNLTKWKAFLEVSHLRFLALFRIQLRDLRAWTLYSAILCGARARGDSYAMRCSPYASVTRTPSKIRSAWLSLAACSPAQRVDPIEVRQILIVTTAPRFSVFCQVLVRMAHSTRHDYLHAGYRVRTLGALSPVAYPSLNRADASNIQNPRIREYRMAASTPRYV